MSKQGQDSDEDQKPNKGSNFVTSRRMIVRLMPAQNPVDTRYTINFPWGLVVKHGNLPVHAALLQH
jgi:hypothetical protein